MPQCPFFTGELDTTLELFGMKAAEGERMIGLWKKITNVTEPVGRVERTDFTVLFSGTDCPRKEIYFMALIDILTHYGMKKRTAAAAKSVKHGANAEISTVKPEQYARR